MFFARTPKESKFNKNSFKGVEKFNFGCTWSVLEFGEILSHDPRPRH